MLCYSRRGFGDPLWTLSIGLASIYDAKGKLLRGLKFQLGVIRFEQIKPYCVDRELEKIRQDARRVAEVCVDGELCLDAAAGVLNRRQSVIEFSSTGSSCPV